MNPRTPPRDDKRDDAPAASASDRRIADRCCRSCSASFIPAGRQVYCTPACRQKAYRGRATGNDIQAVSTTPPRRHRRQVTVYQCPNCEQAYLGEQWCPDCQRPCQRLGYGGLCPHGEEPVSIDQLLTATP